MSLSVFIILLITCSNLCNCVLPVPSEDILKHSQNDEPKHQLQHPQKDDEHKRPKQISVDDLKAKGFVQDNYSKKKKKHTENEPENVPQHVHDIQAKNSAQGNPEENKHSENKPENVPQNASNLKNSAQGNPEGNEHSENKPQNVLQHVNNLKNSAQGNPEGNEHSENKPENVLQHVNNLKNSAQGNPEKKEPTKHKPENVPPLSNEKKPANVINSAKNVTINTASSGKANDEIRSHKKFNHNVNEMDSSTLKRLVLVLVALSILFIMYLAFKTYRGRNRKSRMMVSKYGVRTRRSDLEMRPLPLDEEEEDETVFEVGSVNNR